MLNMPEIVECVYDKLMFGRTNKSTDMNEAFENEEDVEWNHKNIYFDVFQLWKFEMMWLPVDLFLLYCSIRFFSSSSDIVDADAEKYRYRENNRITYKFSNNLRLNLFSLRFSRIFLFFNCINSIVCST